MLTLLFSYSVCHYTIAVAKGGIRVTCEEVGIGGNPWQWWFWELEVVWCGHSCAAWGVGGDI